MGAYDEPKTVKENIKNSKKIFLVGSPNVGESAIF